MTETLKDANGPADNSVLAHQTTKRIMVESVAKVELRGTITHALNAMPTASSYQVPKEARQQLFNEGMAQIGVQAKSELDLKSSYKPMIMQLGEKRITKADALRGRMPSEDSDVVQEEQDLDIDRTEGKKPRKRQKINQSEDTSVSS